MKLVLFGANGPVGRLITQQALDDGHEISAVTRHPDAFPIQHDRLSVLPGDVFNPDDVARAVNGHDAVLSVVGSPFTFKRITVYSQGASNIIAAMGKAGIRRLVCCTSGGTNPRFDRAEGIIFGLIVKRFIGRTLYKDMIRMEEIVMASDLDWTIARPAQLVDGAAVSGYRLEERYMIPKMTKTARIDLADFMLAEAVSPRHIHKALAIATP